MKGLNRNEWFAILAGIIIIAGIIIFVSWTPQNGETVSSPAGATAAGTSTPSASGTASQNQSSQTMTSPQTAALSTKALGQNISTNPDIQIYDLTVGTGTEAVTGDTVAVTYVGALQNGTVFDASSEHGSEPFSFTLGAGQVISGWDIGVAGMKVGGERRLIISPTLGYGAQTVGPIPANSTLIFDVTLLGVTKQ